MIKYAKMDEDSQISVLPDGKVPEGWIEVSEDEYNLDLEAKKVEAISMLSLTAADVERAIYKSKGLDFEDILELVKNNPQIDSKALKIELKANNFYRGNPYVEQIGAILGFTSEELDYLFLNGEFEE